MIKRDRITEKIRQLKLSSKNRKRYKNAKIDVIKSKTNRIKHFI